MPCQELSLYEETGSQESMSLSKESDGKKTPSSHQAANHYALTFRPSTELTWEDVADNLKKHPNVRAFLVGPLKTAGKVDANEHHHCYIRFPLRQRGYLVRSMFPMKIPWMKAIEPNYSTTFTHVEAVNAYIKYACKGGKPLISHGDFLQSYKKPSKCSEIMDKIKQGYRRTQLEIQYPSMVSQISKMMQHRPSREHETQCLYVWGPPGTGKSTTIHKVFQAFKKLDNRADYYPKMGALKKFWDGYDNQPFVLIDDPGQFNVHYVSIRVHTHTTMPGHQEH